MLEAEEVDDNFFTPVSSTTLANIFGNSSRRDELEENESLKYTPPKPVNPSPMKAKLTPECECIFATALYGYEWIATDYISKGKIGFAIVKISNINAHEIVLYDARKISLSKTTISSKLQISIRDKVHISYCDNANKYWSLTTTENELIRIIGILKDLDANIQDTSQSDKAKPKTEEQDSALLAAHYKLDTNDKESDTDSSLNRRTKASILNRMACMGQSVLPRQALTAERTSDSSDNNENEYPKIRHKPVKGIVKRISTEKSVPEQTNSDTHSKVIMTPTSEVQISNIPLYTPMKGQIVPFEGTSFISNTASSSDKDMTLFMTEQRIGNSELRINLNRITDKVDQLFDQIKCLNSNDRNEPSNFQMNIMQKLITEYENKIKMYEKFMQEKGIDYQSARISGCGNNENESIKNKISILEQDISDKMKENQKLITEVLLLKNEIQKLKTESMESSNREQLEITKLNEELSKAKQELTDFISKQNKNNSDTEEAKLKGLMNDIYRTISLNFENTNTYPGSAIKGVIASVIKKVTIDSFGSST